VAQLPYLRGWVCTGRVKKGQILPAGTNSRKLIAGPSAQRAANAARGRTMYGHDVWLKAANFKRPKSERGFSLRIGLN
jgi:hypothetical protein